MESSTVLQRQTMKEGGKPYERLKPKPKRLSFEQSMSKLLIMVIGLLQMFRGENIKQIFEV